MNEVRLLVVIIFESRLCACNSYTCVEFLNIKIKNGQFYLKLNINRERKLLLFFLKYYEIKS